MAGEHTAKTKQKQSIKAKQIKVGGDKNPNKSANLIKYADVLGLSAAEWHDRMIRSRAIKTALQANLLQAAVDADLEGLLTEAIKERSVEKADLLERICKIVGATFREQAGQPGVQVNVSSTGVDKPLSIKFTDATEVKSDGAEPSDK